MSKLGKKEALASARELLTALAPPGATQVKTRLDVFRRAPRAPVYEARALIEWVPKGAKRSRAYGDDAAGESPEAALAALIAKLEAMPVLAPAGLAQLEALRLERNRPGAARARAVPSRKPPPRKPRPSPNNAKGRKAALATVRRLARGLLPPGARRIEISVTVSAASPSGARMEARASMRWLPAGARKLASHTATATGADADLAIAYLMRKLERTRKLGS